MQNSWMKIIIGRIINMLAVLILLFGHVSASYATTYKANKSTKSLKFYKLELTDDAGSFLEDEEEEEEEDFHSFHYYIDLEPFDFLTQTTYSTREIIAISPSKTSYSSLPRWLEVRHILI